MADRSTPADQHRSAEDTTSRVKDQASEVDLADQSTPAYPEPEDPEVAVAEPRPVASDDIGEANPADVVEQSIPVPIDDEDRGEGGT